jgi:uncharacterized protein involved in exopolysaccharide biosynthesis
MEDEKLTIDEGGRAPSLRDFLVVAFRHRRLIVRSFLGILLGVFLSALFLPKSYEAQMKILVKRERLDPMVTSDRNPLPRMPSGVTEEELRSEVELLKSRDLLEKVIIACDLHLQDDDSLLASLFPTSWANEASPKSAVNNAVPQAVRRLEKKLKVAPMKKTNLIEVTYGSSDPQMAARVLTTLADVYLEKHLAVHRPPGASDFFKQQTERYEKKLAAAEGRVDEFNRSEGVILGEFQKEITLEKLIEFDGTLRETQAAIAEARKRIQALGSQAESTPSRHTTQVRTSDNPQLLGELRSTLLTLELERADLLAKFDPTYRPVQVVEEKIAQTRAAIAAAEKARLREETTDRNPAFDWVLAELPKAKTELAGLQARGAAIAQIIRTYDSKTLRLDQKGRVQRDLMRRAQATEENYLLYLRKLEEARISDALDEKRIVNVVVAEAATVPSLPSHRGWLWTLLFGGVLAGLVSMGLAFVSEYMDPSFRTPEEMRKFLNIPVLAAVPKTAGRRCF